MKEKIFMLIIGILIGAVITTGICYAYINSNYSNQKTQMNGGQPPELPSGQNGQPPSKPDGENSQPPEKPNDSNAQNNNTQSNN